MPAIDEADLATAVSKAIHGAHASPAPTVLQHLIAASLSHRIVRALDGGGSLQLAAWLERTTTHYASDRDVAAMLPDACDAAAACLLRHGPAARALAADVATMAETIRARVAARDVVPATHETDGIDELIAGLLLTLDEADALTAEHSRAVSLWCRRIARRMSLDDEQCTLVARGGLLHDIGKTRTPRDILTAPRKLTANEYVIMQDHAAQGIAIISGLEQLRPYAPLVLHHHERLDGNGYPHRLPASEIPLPVRIVTVADCFNAMIGRRPYRLPMSPAGALEQLTANAGTQFDPTVVEAMIDVVTRPE